MKTAGLAPACAFYEIVLSRSRKIRNISPAPILRVPSDLDWKVGSSASGSLYKICRTRRAETFAIGNEKVRTSSSAEIQFRYRATIYSDILPLENKSYTSQEKEREKIYFSTISSSFSFAGRKSFSCVKKITPNKCYVYKRIR